MKSLLKTLISKMFNLQVIVLKKADHLLKSHHLKKSQLLASMEIPTSMEHLRLTHSITTIEEDLKEMFIGSDFIIVKVL